MLGIQSKLVLYSEESNSTYCIHSILVSANLFQQTEFINNKPYLKAQ